MIGWAEGDQQEPPGKKKERDITQDPRTNPETLAIGMAWRESTQGHSLGRIRL